MLTVRVSAVSDPPVNAVYVNEVPATQVGEYWEVPVPLELGENSLVALAENADGEKHEVSQLVHRRDAWPAHYLAVPAGEWDVGCYVVRLREEIAVGQVAAVASDLASGYGGTLGAVWTSQPYAFVMNGVTELAGVTLVEQQSEVTWVEECPLVHPHVVRNVSSSPFKDLDRLDVRSTSRDHFFRSTVGGSGKHIYLIDSGISNAVRNSEDFDDGRIQDYYSVLGTDFSDTDGHGSAMAVLAAGRVHGVARQATLRIMRYGTGGSFGVGGYAGVLACLRHLRDDVSAPLGVVSMSLGMETTPGSMHDTDLKVEIDALAAAGFLIVASAGNENKAVNDGTQVIIPAAYSNVITVAGIDYSTPGQDVRWVNTASQGSRYGPEVDLFAPAKQVRTRNAGGNIDAVDGTSPAAALTSGVLATLAELEPALTPAQRRGMLLGGAAQLPVTNAQSPNSFGQLYSDFGVLEKASIQAPLGTASCAGVSPEMAATAVATWESSPGAVFIAYSVLPSFNCPGTHATNQPVDFVIEKREPLFGSLVWSKTFTDPNGSNSYVGDRILAVQPYSDSGYLRLVLVLSSIEPTRFSVTSAFVDGAAGVDTYVVVLKAEDAPGEQGAPLWTTRIGGPGAEAPYAVAVSNFVSGSPVPRIAVAGVTTGGIGSAVVGGNDAFLWTAPISGGSGEYLQLSWDGSVRIEDSAVVGVVSSAQLLMVVGGTTHDITTGTPLTSVDSMKFEVQFTAPGITVTNRETQALSQMIQTDDWLTAVRADVVSVPGQGTTERLYFSSAARQWDYIGGGLTAYIGNDEVTVRRIDLGPVDLPTSLISPTWSKLTSLYDWTGRSALTLTPEDVYFAWQGGVDKHDKLEGKQAFRQALAIDSTHAAFSKATGVMLWTVDGSTLVSYQAR